jgi:hypothetical protein
MACCPRPSDPNGRDNCRVNVLKMTNPVLSLTERFNLTVNIVGRKHDACKRRVLSSSQAATHFRENPGNKALEGTFSCRRK